MAVRAPDRTANRTLNRFRSLPQFIASPNTRALLCRPDSVPLAKLAWTHQRNQGTPSISAYPRARPIVQIRIFRVIDSALLALNVSLEHGQASPHMGQ